MGPRAAAESLHTPTLEPPIEQPKSTPARVVEWVRQNPEEATIYAAGALATALAGDAAYEFLSGVGMRAGCGLAILDPDSLSQALFHSTKYATEAHVGTTAFIALLAGVSASSVTAGTLWTGQQVKRLYQSVTAESR
ncbi:MAG: hypothetical protein AAFU77_10425 [Myxococcota bacterium]